MSFPIFTLISLVNEQESHSLRQKTCTWGNCTQPGWSHISPTTEKGDKTFPEPAAGIAAAPPNLSKPWPAAGREHGARSERTCAENCWQAGVQALVCCWCCCCYSCSCSYSWFCSFSFSSFLPFPLLLSTVCAALARLFWERSKDSPNRAKAPTDPGCAARLPPSL